MQPKKRTSKPVPTPAKICSFLTGRSGYGLTAILVAMLAAAMIVVPLTRWFLGMSAGTEDLQTKLMVQTIAKDKWDEIHAETFDDLAAALAANPSPWTEYMGDGNRWKIETTIGEEGKYVNAACADEAAGATDRKCRKVSIQVTDTMTGMTQAVNLAKVDSEYLNSRMKAIEDSVFGLGTRMTNAENKFNDYYTKTETDNKIEEEGGGGGGINLAKCTALISCRNGACGYQSATAPNDGYVYTDYTYYFTINGRSVPFQFLTRANYGCDEGSGCGTYNAKAAFSPVNKGDIIRTYVYNGDYYGPTTVATFCPNK